MNFKGAGTDVAGKDIGGSTDVSGGDYCFGSFPSSKELFVGDKAGC